MNIPNLMFQKVHNKVKVIGNDNLVITMFADRGYEVLPDGSGPDEEPDLVCFTGGADVDPKYYNQKNVACGSLNVTRDKKEVAAYNRYINLPKVGICRGGQLLNILSGGRMWQDVNNHGRDHEITDLLLYKTKLWATSTHHQMMIPGEKGDIIAIASKSDRWIADPAAAEVPFPNRDVEVVYYEHTKSLCFQPHPEYVGKKDDCNAYFFDLINYLL